MSANHAKTPEQRRAESEARRRRFLLDGAPQSCSIVESFGTLPLRGLPPSVPFDPENLARLEAVLPGELDALFAAYQKRLEDSSNVTGPALTAFFAVADRDPLLPPSPEQAVSEADKAVTLLCSQACALGLAPLVAARVGKALLAGVPLNHSALTDLLLRSATEPGRTPDARASALEALGAVPGLFSNNMDALELHNRLSLATMPERLGWTLGAALSVAVRRPQRTKALAPLFSSIAAARSVVSPGDNWVQIGSDAAPALSRRFLSWSSELDPLFDALPHDFWVGVKQEVKFKSKLGSWVVRNLREAVDANPAGYRGVLEKLARAAMFSMDKSEILAFDALWPGQAPALLDSWGKSPSSWDGSADYDRVAESLGRPRAAWMSKRFAEAGLPLDRDEFSQRLFSPSATQFKALVNRAFAAALAKEAERQILKASKAASAELAASGAAPARRRPAKPRAL